MSERYEIRVAGSGGQGAILAAIIIGQAAALMEKDLNAVQTQAYGPEARGGASKAEVVLARGEIDYPKATHPDLLVSLTQKASDEYAKDTTKGGIIILDDFFVTEPPKTEAEVFILPIVSKARELGREMVTNMVALGTVARVLEVKSLMRPDSLRKAVLMNVPKGTEELNGEAFDEGYKMMKEKK
ncbi:2-oxoglutarate ferredoxin oxidoreductase subunit gamma [Synergistales bacterium]|nr:2-oxoglutarate ferredoxin oxidoreductase subunit gamma [Synergistales bacterium]